MIRVLANAVELPVGSRTCSIDRRPPPRGFPELRIARCGAARRVCDTLRGAGIEVWFDKSELRGGDVWDQTIRRQIRECALFFTTSPPIPPQARKVTSASNGPGRGTHPYDVAQPDVHRPGVR